MTPDDIHGICKILNLRAYKINDDMSIDVDGNVNLFDSDLNKIPLKFNKVSGYFDCGCNQLTSLENCPNYVGGKFMCDSNYITSLEHFPKIIGGGVEMGCNKFKAREILPYIDINDVIDSDNWWKF